MAIKNIISGIYIIECQKNNKVYIGQTKNVSKRITGHKYALKTGKHSNKSLQSDYELYGDNCFTYILLEECLPENFDDRERFWISQYPNNYNMTSGGKYGNKYSNEARKRLSEVHTGLSNGPHSQDTKRKIGNAQIGKKNHMFGKRHTKESLNKMSLVHTGVIFTEERKFKISQKLIGNKNSLGRKFSHTEESKKKLSIAFKGKKRKPHSEETKRKISESKIGNKNPMYGKKPSLKSITLFLDRIRGKNNSNYVEVTKEMKDDVKNGMKRKDWFSKYGLSQTVWDKIKKGAYN